MEDLRNDTDVLAQNAELRSCEVQRVDSSFGFREGNAAIWSQVGGWDGAVFLCHEKLEVLLTIEVTLSDR